MGGGSLTKMFISFIHLKVGFHYTGMDRVLYFPPSNTGFIHQSLSYNLSSCTSEK